MKRLAHDRAAVIEPGGLEHGADVVRCRAGRDPVDHGRDDGHRVLQPAGQAVVDQFGQVTDYTLGQCAVAGRVVAGHQGERARVGLAPGRDPGDQPGRGRAHEPGQVVAQHRDVGLDLGAAGVEATVGTAQIPRFGHGDRDRGQLGVLEIAEPRIVVGRRMRPGEAAQHLEPVRVTAA